MAAVPKPLPLVPLRDHPDFAVWLDPNDERKELFKVEEQVDIFTLLNEESQEREGFVRSNRAVQPIGCNHGKVKFPSVRPKSLQSLK